MHGPKWKETSQQERNEEEWKKRRNGKGKKGVQTIWKEREIINVYKFKYRDDKF